MKCLHRRFQGALLTNQRATANELDVDSPDVARFSSMSRYRTVISANYVDCMLPDAFLLPLGTINEWRDVFSGPRACFSILSLPYESASFHVGGLTCIARGGPLLARGTSFFSTALEALNRSTGLRTEQAGRASIS